MKSAPFPSREDLFDSLEGTRSFPLTRPAFDDEITAFLISADSLLPVRGDSDHLRPSLDPLCQSTAIPESPSVPRYPESASTSSSEMGSTLPSLSTILRLSRVMP